MAKWTTYTERKALRNACLLLSVDQRQELLRTGSYNVTPHLSVYDWLQQQERSDQADGVVYVGQLQVQGGRIMLEYKGERWLAGVVYRRQQDAYDQIEWL